MTEKLEVSLVRPAVEAVTVSAPAVCAVAVTEATPPLAVAVPSPVTDPAPAVLAILLSVSAVGLAVYEWIDIENATNIGCGNCLSIQTEIEKTAAEMPQTSARLGENPHAIAAPSALESCHRNSLSKVP